MSSTSQVTTFSDLVTDVQNRVRVTTGVTATETQAKRYVNIALHDFNLGFQYKLPWLERTAQLRTHAPYSTGTVAISVGSTSLTGTGSLWNTANSYGEANARTTRKLVFEGTTDIYPITTVTSDTAIALTNKYVGSAALSGATYTYFEDTYDLASDFLRYRHAIVYHALYHWYRDKRDDARSQEAKAEYTDIMLRIVDDQDFGAPTKAHIHPANMYSAKRPYRAGLNGRVVTGSRFDQGR